MNKRVFLGVERSILGQGWDHALDPRAEAAALRMAQETALPDIVCRVLAARGVDPAGADAFLRPTIRDLMPDPALLTDMEAAASRLADAVERKERVAIFGDYDVDGAASSALLHRYLRHLGVETEIRIPDRIRDGYGPNAIAMRDFARTGATLIVTVDCGTTSFEALEEAARLGVDVIVLDHHQSGPALPPAAAIVNPNRQDDLSGQGMLCAAGVVFLCLAAVSREMRRRGAASGRLPDLLPLLDLVALATVCDVVPLVGLNRAFVVRGLEVMRQGANVGLRALASVARLAVASETQHLGFILGPRINAGGRIGEADLGVRLLTTSDEAEAARLAETLDVLNGERQAMEQAMLVEAEAEVAAEIGMGEGPPVLVAGREAWHPGIVGLIAARLKERYGRPAFAFAFDGTARGTGSGRSVAGFDLGALVRRAVDAGIAAKGGGHAMAAGLTIERSKLGDFRALTEAFAREVADRSGGGSRLAIDGALTAAGATPALVADVERAGPYGAGSSAPVFVLPRHRVTFATVVGGGGHVRATLKGADGATVSAMAFRAAETPVGRRLLVGDDAPPIHVAGNLTLDRYRGRETVSLRILDLAEAPR